MVHRPPRGSALMVAVVVVLVLSVLGVGLVRLATSETAGALAGARREALAQCADAARQLLMSKFHTLGMNPLRIAALNVPLDGTGGRTRAVGGHIDSTPGPGTLGVDIGQVTYLPDNATGQQKWPDETNKIVVLGGAGGRPMKVTVHCKDHGDDADPTSGRQLEIEFGVVFGL